MYKEKSEHKIVLFGDSITKDYASYFQKEITNKYPEKNYEIINLGVASESSRDGLKRLDDVLVLKPDIVVIGFGMNDWRDGCDGRYGVSKIEYKKNLTYMVEEFEKIGTRVLLNTLSPSYNFENDKYNEQTKEYSNVVRRIARATKIKIIDIEIFWERDIPNLKDGLRDYLHPNKKGYQLISKYLTLIVPRKHTTVLWQYNGGYAKCNYRCPYCYYIGMHEEEDRFTGYMDQWHERFKESFGNQSLIFYLAFGEPTIGKEFPNILKMIEQETKWKLRITTNASSNLELLANSKLAKEKRLFINASFHPSEITIEEFIKNISYLRDSGIEVSVVYVAYLPFLKRLEDDIRLFSEHGFVVHVRRYQGKYKDKIYPWAYTDEEKQFIAKYMDDISIKNMLNQQDNLGDMVFSGFDFFIVDNAGNIGYDSNAFTPYTKDRAVFGNIHTGNFRPMLYPTKYPGYYQATTDGVSNLLSSGLKQLEGNNILHFAKQGGVYKDENGKIIYKNLEKDFNNVNIRKEYYFSSKDN
ncbi:MAG: GDSL-type esterase/lipase family protein [Campylobacterota bacterium]|nr:GDSL-type esterase/lipase family protein [Campylobacterota bacterium]